jgi:hypothetical protein
VLSNTDKGRGSSRARDTLVPAEDVSDILLLCGLTHVTDAALAAAVRSPLSRLLTGVASGRIGLQVSNS